MSGNIDDAEQKKLREDVNKMYTPLSVAKKEIQKRWKDKELRKKVEDFLGDARFLKTKWLNRAVF